MPFPVFPGKGSEVRYFIPNCAQVFIDCVDDRNRPLLRGWVSRWGVNSVAPQRPAAGHTQQYSLVLGSKKTLRVLPQLRFGQFKPNLSLAASLCVFHFEDAFNP
jgi:hypothetical protein